MKNCFSKQRRINQKAVLLIVSVIVVALGPVVLQLFSLRNDQNLFFLPLRMYMSDAFAHGTFPFWNPYLSGSYPMHSDMQAPIWNPITLLLSWLFRYNSSLLSIELVLYYFIAGTGAFYFARNFSKNTYTAIVLALCYACGGFATSILEFMSWVGSFAFLPWAVHYYYLLLKEKKLVDAFKLAIALWLLVVSGYPSFIIYLGYIFISSFFLYIVILYRQNRKDDIRSLIRYSSVALIVSVILSLPAIHSFIEYMPYYARGKRASTGQLMSERFSFAYPLSFIFPSSLFGAVKEDDFQQGTYIGLIPFLLLLLGWRGKWPSGARNWYLLIGFCLTFMFTLGRSTPLRIWSADHLPLLGKFGFSHSVRVFIILGLFVWLAPLLDRLFSGKVNFSIKRIRITALLLLAFLIGYFSIFYHIGAFRYNYSRFFFIINGIWQCMLLCIIIAFPKLLFRKQQVMLFFLIDIVASVYCVIPVSGLSSTPPSVYNQYAARFYETNTKPYLLQPDLKTKEMLAMNYYKKVNAVKIVPQNLSASNTRNEAYVNYVADTSRYNELFALPFAYSDKPATAIQVQQLQLNYNSIETSVLAKDTGWLVLMQTYHHRWRAVDPQHRISAYKGVFLQVRLEKGQNHIRLYYYTKDLLIETLVAVTCLLVTLAFILRQKKS